MKKNIVNILATTGISLLLLSVVALFFHASCIYLETVFQAFLHKHHYSYRNNDYSKNRIKKYFY